MVRALFVTGVRAGAYSPQWEMLDVPLCVLTCRNKLVKRNEFLKKGNEVCLLRGALRVFECSEAGTAIGRAGLCVLCATTGPHHTQWHL